MRLVRPQLDVPLGSFGRVTGVYRRVAGAEIAVSFDGGRNEVVALAAVAIVSLDDEPRDSPIHW